MTEETDLLIIQHVLGGDTQRYGELIKRYQSSVATTAFNMLGDVNEAEEVGQQTFIRLYNSLEKYKARSSLNTYITRICINLCLNRLKQLKRSRNRAVELDAVNDLPTNSNSFQESDYKELVKVALSRLSEKHRTVVVLRMIQGYSSKEAGAILGIPQGTVLSRLKRAMDQLQTVLKDELNYEHFE